LPADRPIVVNRLVPAPQIPVGAIGLVQPLLEDAVAGQVARYLLLNPRDVLVAVAYYTPLLPPEADAIQVFTDLQIEMIGLSGIAGAK